MQTVGRGDTKQDTKPKKKTTTLKLPARILRARDKTPHVWTTMRVRTSSRGEPLRHHAEAQVMSSKSVKQITHISKKKNIQPTTQPGPVDHKNDTNLRIAQCFNRTQSNFNMCDTLHLMARSEKSAHALQRKVCGRWVLTLDSVTTCTNRRPTPRLFRQFRNQEQPKQVSSNLENYVALGLVHQARCKCGHPEKRTAQVQNHVGQLAMAIKHGVQLCMSHIVSEPAAQLGTTVQAPTR